MSSCPVCSNNNSAIFCKKNNFILLRCNKCSYIYVYPSPSNILLNKFYNMFDYKDLDLAEKRIRQDSRISINFIKKYIKKTNNILDVGCGRGYFLDELRKQNYLNLEGIDFSYKIIEYAQKNLNLKVQKVDIFKFRKKKQYQLIVLNQVIEHIRDINKLIPKLNSLLQKKSYLYIATPNINSLSSLIFKDNFEYIIPPEHLNYFNKKSISKLLKINGFEIIAISTWGYPENIAGIIKYFFKQNKNKHLSTQKKSNKYISSSINYKYIIFDKIICFFISKIIDKLGLGINIQIIARKR